MDGCSSDKEGKWLMSKRSEYVIYHNHSLNGSRLAFKFAKVLKAFGVKYGVIYSDNRTNTTVCQIKTGAIFNDSHELYDHFEELMGGNFGNENLLKRYT
jgi:hypothetical protein